MGLLQKPDEISDVKFGLRGYPQEQIISDGSLALGDINAAHGHLFMRTAVDYLEKRSLPRSLLQLHGVSQDDRQRF